MTARLMVREVGQREFIAHNGDYEDDLSPGTLVGRDTDQTGLEKALAEGERLCSSGKRRSLPSLVARDHQTTRLGA